jgi:hypothetical protein
MELQGKADMQLTVQHGVTGVTVRDQTATLTKAEGVHSRCDLAANLQAPYEETSCNAVVVHNDCAQQAC